MELKKEGNTTIVSQEAVELDDFLINLEQVYPEIEESNLIVDLFVFEDLTPAEIARFRPISDLHRESGKFSFVLVTPNVDVDEVPESLYVVPTIQEAHDMIQMDAIARDLED